MDGEVWYLASTGAISPASLSECRLLVYVPGLVIWGKVQGLRLEEGGT